MTSIGFLGCDKIDKTMIKHIKSKNDHSVVFVQDPFFKNDCHVDCLIVTQLDETVCKADLIVESATADALKQYFEYYIQ